MILIQKPRDVIGGLVVIAIGAGFFPVRSGTGDGNLVPHGAGLLSNHPEHPDDRPGAVIAVQALRAPTTEHSFGQVPWRGLLLLIGAVLFFGFVVRGLGLAPAVLIVVLTTAWASRYARCAVPCRCRSGLRRSARCCSSASSELPLPLTGPWLSVDYWSSAPSAPALPAEPPTPSQ